jgi:D-alanine-D-alanine ligase
MSPGTSQRTKRDFQVAILYNDDREVSRGTPQDLVAIADTVNTANSLYKSLTSLQYDTVMIAVHNSLDELEAALKRYSPERTFIFSNCDGFGGSNSGAIEVIRLVETLGFKHTGASAATMELCIDKACAKSLFLQAGVPTPRFQVFEKAEGACTIDLPIIVKPINEDGSIGIDLESVVDNHADLYQRIQYILDLYQEPVMAEEFVPGRELAVSMLGNAEIEVLPIGEEDYSNIENPLQRLITYEAKWDENSPFYQNIPLHVPASLAAEEYDKVCQAARGAFRALGLSDFGRADMRLYKDIPYVIEVNELPDLAPGSGFYKSAEAAGMSHPEMVEKILVNAMKREGWMK